jgi:hypothetical protein
VLIDLVGDLAGGDLLSWCGEVGFRVVALRGRLLERHELLHFRRIPEPSGRVLAFDEDGWIHESGCIHLIVLQLLLLFVLFLFFGLNGHCLLLRDELLLVLAVVLVLEIVVDVVGLVEAILELLDQLVVVDVLRDSLSL